MSYVIFDEDTVTESTVYDVNRYEHFHKEWMNE